MPRKPRILALFPGQGSQKVGMGRALFDTEPLARELFAVADERLGFSLSRLCFEGPEEELTLTKHAQPALLTLGTVCYRLFGERFEPVAGAGHSLGEYSALVAADALEFADAAELVHKRGKYMQEAVPPGEGKMVAVLGKDLETIETALRETRSAGVAEVANINAPGQIVVSGSAAGVDAFTKKLGGKVIALAVSAPFHSSLMRSAEERLSVDLKSISIRPPRFPIYSNYSARPLTSPEQIRQALALQICGRVRWVESMQAAIEETRPDGAVEFGGGATLTGMMKRIAPKARCIAVDLPPKADEAVALLTPEEEELQSVVG